MSGGAEMKSIQNTMLDGGEVTAEETLAIQLWYTWRTERGDFSGAFGSINPMYIAAQAWVQMDRHDRDVWIAVAEKAMQLVPAREVGRG